MAKQKRKSLNEDAGRTQGAGTGNPSPQGSSVGNPALAAGTAPTSISTIIDPAAATQPQAAPVSFPMGMPPAIPPTTSVGHINIAAESAAFLIATSSTKMASPRSGRGLRAAVDLVRWNGRPTAGGRQLYEALEEKVVPSCKNRSGEIAKERPRNPSSVAPDDKNPGRQPW